MRRRAKCEEKGERRKRRERGKREKCGYMCGRRQKDESFTSGRSRGSRLTDVHRLRRNISIYLSFQLAIFSQKKLLQIAHFKPFSSVCLIVRDQSA